LRTFCGPAKLFYPKAGRKFRAHNGISALAQIRRGKWYHAPLGWNAAPAGPCGHRYLHVGCPGVAGVRRLTRVLGPSRQQLRVQQPFFFYAEGVDTQFLIPFAFDTKSVNWFVDIPLLQYACADTLLVLDNLQGLLVDHVAQLLQWKPELL